MSKPLISNAELEELRKRDQLVDAICRDREEAVKEFFEALEAGVPPMPKQK